MSNIRTALKKLKKRSHFRVLNVIVRAYFIFSCVNQNTFIAVLPFITPKFGRKLLSKYGKHLPKSQQDFLASEINKFDQEKIIEPQKRLKIAVCMSGEPRSYTHCIDSFKRFFHGHDVTIYIASKNEEFNESLKSQYQTENIFPYKDPSFKELEVKGFKKFGFKSERDGLMVANASPNLYPMWYGVYKSAEYLIKNPSAYSEYDAVCRCRFDNFFIKPMDLTDIAKNSIYIDPNYNEHNGYSDHFSIGSPEAMVKYLNLYSWIEESFLQDFGEKGYLPERVLKKYLIEYCNVNVIPYEFESRLFRVPSIGLASYKIPIKDFQITKDRNVRLNNYIKENHPGLLPTTER